MYNGDDVIDTEYNYEDNNYTKYLFKNHLKNQLSNLEKLIYQTDTQFIPKMYNDIILRNIIGKMKYITNNTTENIIYQFDTKYSMKITLFDYNDKKFINTELSILLILGKLLENCTPHILVPILYGTADETNSLMRSFNYMIKKNQYNSDKEYLNKLHTNFKEIKHEYDKKYFSNTLFYMYTKWCNQSDLSQYLKTNTLSEADWKTILFKIIYTLATIQHYYPSFRHNDLSLRNILVHIINKRNCYDTYSIDDNTYYIPDNGIEVYLWDFEYSNIYELTENNLITENSKMKKEYGIRLTENQFYDIHFLLNGIYHNITALPNRIKKFIERQIKKDFLGIDNEYVYNFRLIEDIKYTTPRAMLNDILFQDLKTRQNISYYSNITCCGTENVMTNERHYSINENKSTN